MVSVMGVVCVFLFRVYISLTLITVNYSCMYVCVCLCVYNAFIRGRTYVSTHSCLKLLFVYSSIATFSIAEFVCFHIYTSFAREHIFPVTRIL